MKFEIGDTVKITKNGRIAKVTGTTSYGVELDIDGVPMWVFPNNVDLFKIETEPTGLGAVVRATSVLTNNRHYYVRLETGAWYRKADYGTGMAIENSDWDDLGNPVKISDGVQL